MTAERVNRLLSALPGSGLPADLQAWLREMFSRQSVEVDLGERDALIRLAISLSPGGSQTAKCAYFLDCIDGKEHSSATARDLIDKLHGCDVYVPHSVKQLKRILNYRRQDGWRTGLCPSMSFGNDGENHRGKHK